MGRRIALIAVGAILLRLIYQFAMIDAGGSFHNGSDSEKYINIAEAIVATGEFAYIDTRFTPTSLIPATDRMPLYPYFLAGMMELFGDDALPAAAVLQTVMDGLTVILLALTAAAIDRRYAVPTAIFAAVIPNFLVHAAYILTETLFLMFSAAAIAALLWALRDRRTVMLLACAGVMLGLTLLTRPVMMFFPLFLFPALAYALPAAKRVSVGRGLALAALPVVIMVAFAVPRIIDNHDRFGHAVLTTQSGNHLLKWVYPCVNTPWSCASHGTDWDANKPLVDARLAELTPEQRANPAEINAVYQSVAKEKIAELGIVQIAIGMTVGAIKNTIQTGFYETVTQFRQAPNFLSAMPGSGIGEKLANFYTTNKGDVFMLAWAVAQAALLVSRLMQAVGLGTGIAQSALRPYTVMLLMTIAYFLAVNGPVGNPKYRVPAEPGFLILLSMGLYTIIDVLRRRRQERAQ